MLLSKLTGLCVIPPKLFVGTLFRLIVGRDATSLS